MVACCRRHHRGGGVLLSRVKVSGCAYQGDGWHGSSVNQTSITFGALVVAFIVYITVRGDLAKWLGVLGLAGSAPASLPAAQNPNAGLPTLPALPSFGAGGMT